MASLIVVIRWQHYLVMNKVIEMAYGGLFITQKKSDATDITNSNAVVTSNMAKCVRVVVLFLVLLPSIYL